MQGLHFLFDVLGMVLIVPLCGIWLLSAIGISCLPGGRWVVFSGFGGAAICAFLYHNDFVTGMAYTTFSALVICLRPPGRRSIGGGIGLVIALILSWIDSMSRGIVPSGIGDKIYAILSQGFLLALVFMPIGRLLASIEIEPKTIIHADIHHRLDAQRRNENTK